jgi:hypothetical protein
LILPKELNDRVWSAERLCLLCCCSLLLLAKSFSATQKVGMSIDSIYAWCIYALCIPFVLIGMILVHYALRRVSLRRRQRRGKRRLGFYPSAFALGMALQFMQVFTRPSVAHVLEQKQKQEADEDDDGDPETAAGRLKHFHRQLRRIRRGEAIDRLVLRM